MNHSATLNLDTEASLGIEHGSKRVFARHFVEMILVMFLGMAVLGGLAEAGFAVSGGQLSQQSGAFQVALMGLTMTIPMVAWMAYRGHTPAQNAEMAGSMIVPTVIAAMLALAGALDLASALELQHGVMIAAMLGVMLWRYEDYSRH